MFDFSKEIFLNYLMIFNMSEDNFNYNTLKKQYRLLSKQYHPDLHPNSKHYNEKMQEINLIYEYLSLCLNKGYVKETFNDYINNNLFEKIDHLDGIIINKFKDYLCLFINNKNNVPSKARCNNYLRLIITFINDMYNMNIHYQDYLYKNTTCNSYIKMLSNKEMVILNKLFKDLKECSNKEDVINKIETLYQKSSFIEWYILLSNVNEDNIKNRIKKL